MTAPSLNPELLAVTDRIKARSRASRRAYLAKIEKARRQGPHRGSLSCSNLAHGFAACGAGEKQDLRGEVKPNVAIVSAYNDMLSAHQPLQFYPDLIREAVEEAGGVAQFAGGVPAMCDGVTQGQPGMDLSLFSRDVIALSATVALSHNMFDAALYLGVCDKIVPGLLIAALTFGQLPAIFISAGPMTSGLPNEEKAQIRQAYARGEIDRQELLEAESQSYHSPGTCTFYGTANSNQLLLEFMGLHLPGTTFFNPGTAMREAAVRAAAQRVTQLSDLGSDYRPIGQVVDEKAIVNALVALMATGGSTNHTLHWIAVAEAAGIRITWQDMADISRLVPLLVRVYPNGTADVNHLDAAGGIPFLMRELRDAGLLHSDVLTVQGERDAGLTAYGQEARLDGKNLRWQAAGDRSHDSAVLRGVADPFQPSGGLTLLTGNLGQSVIKTSAIKPEHQRIEAPARLFHSQQAFLDAFARGELHRDFVAVLRFQGPCAIGMPELHQLTPSLSVLQNLGFQVALVTDGRMSGASGKVPAAIHLTPEATDAASPLARVRDGDLIRLDAPAGLLEVVAPDLMDRAPEPFDPQDQHEGMGRELFGLFRRAVGPADQGASVFR